MPLTFDAPLSPQVSLTILHSSLGNQCEGVTAHRGTPPPPAVTQGQQFQDKKSHSEGRLGGDVTSDLIPLEINVPGASEIARSEGEGAGHRA